MTDPSVELLYLEGCPNWELTAVRLSIALQVTDHASVHVQVRRVDAWDEAVAVGFTGSPMVRINGSDPFSPPGQPAAFACRMFREGDTVTGAPSVAQLVAALRAAP